MKRLIICCDGTWNSADQAKEGEPCPTNVLKLAYRIAKRDPAGVLQIIHYGQGVGTGNVADKFIGGAFGDGLEGNIYDAYRFLIANYEDGDEIYVFGFSRGAFTARSAVGLVRKCGVLTRTSVASYLKVVALYRNPSIHPNDDKAVEFRGANSICGENPIPIKFVGVWDTVGALGIPLTPLRGRNADKYQFHDTQLSKTVQFAYHALAIDERRGPFAPTLWDYIPKPEQTVEQVWFAGVHSDVGGGYPETALSDLPLEWMIQKATASGLAFDQAAMAVKPINGNPTGTLHDSKTGFYNLSKGKNRTIGGEPTQSIHPSVLSRWDADSDYRPDNLRAYFKAISDPRGEAK